MKVIDHLKNSNGKTLFTIEILPPLKGENIRNLFDNIDPLMEFKPPFIDVTYHREEYVYRKMPNGFLDKISTRKRPISVGICAAIQNHYKIDTVPHIICGGFSREETENALIDLHFLGVDNVLLLQGDAIKSESKFVAEPDGHRYASELLEQVVKMNKGKYLDDEIQIADPTNFCIGVAGYPEKHFNAPNLKSDLKYFKLKVDMGAQYIVTQMFFDNRKFFDFVDLCRENGINVPIIPGLKILSGKKQFTTLPKIFNIDLPHDFYEELEKCKDDKQVKEVGIKWCIQQSKELVKA